MEGKTIKEIKQLDYSIELVMTDGTEFEIRASGSDDYGFSWEISKIERNNDGAGFSMPF